MSNPYPGDPDWPTNWGGATITGTYVGLDGTPFVGTVTFTPAPPSILDASTMTVIIPATLTATLDVNGHFSITVPATDDPDINPTGWTYQVSENFVGGRKYSIFAPLGTTVDLSAVAPVPPADGTPIIVGPAGPPNTLAIGAVSYATAPSASITGTAPHQLLNLTLPTPVNVDGGTPASSAPGALDGGSP